MSGLNLQHRKPNLIIRYEEQAIGDSYFDAEEYAEILQYYLRKLQIREALMAADESLVQHTNSTELQYLQARALLELKRDKEVYISIQKCFVLFAEQGVDSDNKTLDDLLLLNGELLLKEGKEEAALQNFETLMRKRFYSLSLSCIHIAYIYISNEKYHEALAFLRHGLKADPKDEFTLLEIAACHEKLGEIDKAIYTYEKMLSINPFHKEAWLNLGRVCTEVERYAKAIESYSFALAIDENDYLAGLLLAHAYYENGNYQKAADQYTQHANIDQEDAPSLIFIADCYEQMENFSVAINYYKIALEKQKDHPDALRGMGNCLLSTGAYRDCIHFLLRAADVDATSAETWANLGTAYYQLDFKEEALDALLNAHSLDPKEASLLINLGNFYFEQGEFEHALHFYLLIGPDDIDPDSWELLLALTYYGLEKYDKAEIILQRLVKVEPEQLDSFLSIFPDAHENLNLDV